MTEPTLPAAAGHAPTPDEAAMDLALRAAAAVRPFTSPNPWVGAVLVDSSGDVVATGATEPPGGRHAEIVALDSAGERAAGATLVCTLEPCAHHGRTPPCVERIVASGVRRVVIGVGDPDPHVAGRGLEALRSAGIEVIEGVRAHEVTAQLTAYLHQRRTGRPYVVCKLAASLDGRTAAVDGSSHWITGEAARTDVHRLRSESDAIIVGAGTVRADDPELTVRHVEGRDPQRVVLGTAPPGAKVHPCLEWDGPLPELLDQLGAAGVVQVLVEGGATVARSFHEAGLVDRFVVYLAPALFGGRDGVPLIGGATAATIDGVWRGRFGAIDRLGDDVRVELFPVELDRVDEPGLPLGPIAEPLRHRHSTEMLVERAATARVPTEWGDFRCHSFTSSTDGETHLAFTMGHVAGGEPVLVRVHSECVTGDVFGSVKCDCGPQLREAMRLVAAAGRGVVVYLRGHEGRGIGISHKLRAYELQDRGLDTVDANVELGLPIDRREYGIGAQILVDLGVRRMRLLTNNPAKYGGLGGFGLSIEERIPLHLPAHPEAVGYLRAKRDRMGHLLPDELGLPADAEPA